MVDQVGKVAVGVEADASGLGDDIVDQTEGEVKKKGTTLGTILGKGLKVGAVAAAGGIAAVLTGALVKGFGRLTSIDSAKAKLEGLGYTGKVLQGVMDNALNSVKGTAFGLDEAVSAVPGLLAAGVKPGQALEQTLKNMASAATLGGTSFAEVSDVFGDAAAAGNATTDTFNRLAQRGIPALQMVADSLGVTREEAAKMATKGQISFQQLQDALTKGIGPAALAAGDSFQGMLANTGAALGRLGAEILGPVFEGLKKVMPTLIAAFDQLTAVIGPTMDRIGPIITKLFDNIAAAIEGVNWKQVAGFIKTITNLFLDWAPAILAVTAAIVGLYTAFKIAQGIMLAYNAVMAVVKAAQLGYAAATYGAAAASYVLAEGSVALKLAMIAGVIAQNIATAATWLFSAALWANPITWIVLAIVALIAALVLLVLNWDKVVKFVTDVWGNFITWITGVIDGFVSWWSGVWEGIVKVWNDIWTAILNNPVIKFIGTVIRVYIETWINIFLVLAAVLKVIWDGIVAAVMWAWNGIVAFVTPIIQYIADTIEYYTNLILSIWQTVWGAVSTFFSDIWTNIVSFLTPIAVRLYTIISGVLNTVKGIWNSVWGGIAGFFQGIWNSIVGALASAISQITSVFRTLKDKILAPLAGAATWLYNVGKDIITGMINGIKSMFNNIKNAISDTVNGVIDWAKNILGSHSPSKVFDGIGKDLGQGFVNGIDAMAGKVQAAVGTMTMGAVDVAGTTVSTIPAGQAAAASTSTTTSTFTVEQGAFQLAGADPYRVSKLVVDRLSERTALVAP